MGAGFGSGFRKSAGGHGWRNQYFATGMPGWMRSNAFGGPTAGQADMPTDRELLQKRSQILQSELEAINQQLNEME